MGDVLRKLQGEVFVLSIAEPVEAAPEKSPVSAWAAASTSSRRASR